MFVNRLPLSNTWDFRLDHERDWRSIRVPGCWEALGVHKQYAGPAWYRTRFATPPDWAGRRVWLRFGGVSYHCEINVNGRAVGEHTGLWDAFAVEITAAVEPGAQAELILRVEKPAGMERGPSSAGLAGRFALRETLAGFLPYVWGHVFGGIWQDVSLVATGPAVFEDVHVRGAPDGRVIVEAELSGPGDITLELRDPDGMLFFSTAERAESAENTTQREHPPAISAISAVNYLARFEATIPDPRPWSPDLPALYEARLRIAEPGLSGDERTLRFGLRALDVDGTTMRLNGRPIYPRMALSWGWYPDVLNSNPGLERVRADLERLKSLGYNGVKLCLWFPPQYYFDLADELGMLLWVELPMWLPNPTAFFRGQTPLEYDRLVRQARNHPSVILYSLGCELNRAVGADILGPLFAMVKLLGGDALVRDNSGSGEAYGGLLNEHAEYYDYHFYSDLPFYRGLIDEFSPRWRPEQPWLFGEFCDADTFRDLRRLDDRQPTTDDRQGVLARVWSVVSGQSSIVGKSWWTRNDPEVNPQGARWQYEVVHQEARLRASGFWDRGEELERISERQALIYRKYVLELVRAYREIGGYVITGERDSPISTPGMWDDSDRLKFDPAEFCAFNADLVLLVGWDRRRTWIGGDRAARWDGFSYSAGAPVRPHLIASHYGAATGRARVAWQAAFDGEAPFAAGDIETSFTLRPGDLREVAIAEWIAPEVPAPRRAILRATLQIGDEHAENAWPLWFFPRDYWRGLSGVALVDPTGRLRDLPQIFPDLVTAKDAKEYETSIFATFAVQPKVVIATAWTAEVADFVGRGGAALLLQAPHGPAGPIPMVEMPFWREAIRIAEPHPAWGDFPYADVGMQFYGCAADHALDTAALGGVAAPILRRLDARSMRLADYAVELVWGRGRAIVTTLRFEGGAGDQPLGIGRNTAAAYLLNCWVRYLLGSRD
jgi:Glycosyl hydrolases family 2, sugar binding domain/Glycosyl hydrolases family 2